MDFGTREIGYWPALLALDPAQLEAWLLPRGVSPGAPSIRVRSAAVGSSPAAPLPTQMARLWLALMRGERFAADHQAVLAHAMASRDPDRVIEATALRALSALSREETSEALTLGRRASIMARTEALPEAEVLANVVLARLRRHAAKPYLAVRILDVLARLAPRHVGGWIAWERLLAGGTERGSPPEASHTAADRAVFAARALLLAAEDGRRPAFDRARGELLATTASFVDVAREASALAALLDPQAALDESLTSFCRGEHDRVPLGLSGVRVSSGSREPAISVFVAVRPHESGRRLLQSGLGLFGKCRMLSCETNANREHGRTDAGLSALALAGPDALSEDEFFQRVYGFPFATVTHRGVLDVLVHRMRKRIGQAGRVERGAGRLLLVVDEPLAMADPRCSLPAAARILTALARQPCATADAIAGSLGITLRAAQIALRQLVGDGVCRVRRAGRRFEYQLEDTTFSEPTGQHAFG